MAENEGVGREERLGTNPRHLETSTGGSHLSTPLRRHPAAGLRRCSQSSAGSLYAPFPRRRWWPTQITCLRSHLERRPSSLSTPWFVTTTMASSLMTMSLTHDSSCTRARTEPVMSRISRTRSTPPSAIRGAADETAIEVSSGFPVLNTRVGKFACQKWSKLSSRKPPRSSDHTSPTLSRYIRCSPE